MEIYLVLEQVIMVLVLVAQEETDASIKPWQPVLRWIVSEAMADSVDKAIQVRHPVLSQQILVKRFYMMRITTLLSQGLVLLVLTQGHCTGWRYLNI